MSDKNKPSNQSGDYREEMEELARIFKEELDKTIEESENTKIDEEYEVEGYEVTMGDKKPVEELTEERKTLSVNRQQKLLQQAVLMTVAIKSVPLKKVKKSAEMTLVLAVVVKNTKSVAVRRTKVER